MTYGDGTRPYRRPDGRWAASVEDGWYANGKRRRRWATATTEAECKRRLRNLKRDINAGRTLSVDPRTTVRTWIEKTWKPDYKNNARPRTYSSDMSLIDRWIIPTIGNRRLSALTVQDLRALDKAGRGGGLSKTSVNYLRRLLRRILRAAIVEGYTVPDPVMMAPLPQKGTSDRTAIAPADCGRLLDAAAVRDQWTEPIVPPGVTGRAAREIRRQHHRGMEVHHSRWLAAILQGMRQGECLGLTWDRVDLHNKVIRVDRQMVELGRNDDPHASGLDYVQISGGYWWGPPKSEAGERDIPLIPAMVEALKEWKKVCPQSPDGLVWPRLSGAPYSKSDDRAAFRGLQDAAGVHKGGRGTAEAPWVYYVVHEARHSTATLLMALDVPAPVIIAIMGHSTIASTRRYQHADIDQARRALEGVAGLLQIEAPDVAQQ